MIMFMCLRSSSTTEQARRQELALTSKRLLDTSTKTDSCSANRCITTCSSGSMPFQRRRNQTSRSIFNSLRIQLLCFQFSV